MTWKIKLVFLIVHWELASASLCPISHYQPLHALLVVLHKGLSLPLSYLSHYKHINWVKGMKKRKGKKKKQNLTTRQGGSKRKWLQESPSLSVSESKRGSPTESEQAPSSSAGRHQDWASRKRETRQPARAQTWARVTQETVIRRNKFQRWGEVHTPPCPSSGYSVPGTPFPLPPCLMLLVTLTCLSRLSSGIFYCQVCPAPTL